jgi:hypothetical protein
VIKHRTFLDDRSSGISTIGTALAENNDLYATRKELCKLFSEDMSSLYLLSLVLTGDRETAERCFVAGLDDCVDGSAVFRRWAHSWARRVIVRNAIRIIGSRPGMASRKEDSACRRMEPDVSEWTAEEVAFSRVVLLNDFERFVFVLSVLEKYSDKDCALLLSTSMQQVREARLQALEHIAEPEQAVVAQ